MLHTYENQTNEHGNLLRINKLDNFLCQKICLNRFRRTDSLCEFLKKPFCKNLN